MNIAPPRSGGSTLQPPPKWLPLVSTSRVPSAGDRIRPAEKRTPPAGGRTPLPGERTPSAGSRIQPLEQRTRPSGNLTPHMHKPLTTHHPPSHSQPVIPHRRTLASAPLDHPTNQTSHSRPRHGYVPNCSCYHRLGYYHVGGECITASTEANPEKKEVCDGDETMRGRSRYRREKSDMKGKREGRREESIREVNPRDTVVEPCCEKVVSGR